MCAKIFPNDGKLTVLCFECICNVQISERRGGTRTRTVDVANVCTKRGHINHDRHRFAAQHEAPVSESRHGWVATQWCKHTVQPSWPARNTEGCTAQDAGLADNTRTVQHGTASDRPPHTSGQIHSVWWNATNMHHYVPSMEVPSVTDLLLHCQIYIKMLYWMLRWWCFSDEFCSCLWYVICRFNVYYSMVVGNNLARLKTKLYSKAFILKFISCTIHSKWQNIVCTHLVGNCATVIAYETCYKFARFLVLTVGSYNECHCQYSVIAHRH